jgi:hypothetical protein
VARVRELLAAGARPDKPVAVAAAGGRARRRAGETALVGAITAAVADNTAALAALLDAAPPDQSAMGEALLAAAKYGRADYMRTYTMMPCLRLSLCAVCLLHAHSLVCGLHAHTAEMLLAAGAEPNVRESAYGNTPLMLAALRCAHSPPLHQPEPCVAMRCMHVDWRVPL